MSKKSEGMSGSDIILKNILHKVTNGTDAVHYCNLSCVTVIPVSYPGYALDMCRVGNSQPSCASTKQSI